MSEPLHAILIDGEVIITGVAIWQRWIVNHQTDALVAYRTIGEVRIVTAFVGTNLGTTDHLLWFETLITGGALDGKKQQYATLEDAMLGHEYLVTQIVMSNEE